MWDGEFEIGVGQQNMQIQKILFKNSCWQNKQNHAKKYAELHKTQKDKPGEQAP